MKAEEGKGVGDADEEAHTLMANMRCCETYGYWILSDGPWREAGQTDGFMRRAFDLVSEKA